jgi:hypothetical protein
LGDGGGGSLLAQGEDFDGEVAAFVFDLERVADVDFAGWFSGLAVGEDALEITGFGGLLAGFEEAGGPEPLVDAGSGHALIVADFLGGLDCSERADGQVEDGSDEGERASDGDTYEAEGKQDEPDEWIEDQSGERERPAEEGEEAEEEEVEHRVLCLS